MPTAAAAIAASYAEGLTDEFVLPTIIGPMIRRAASTTAIPSVFFNFRPDRTRELTRAFIDAGFVGFDRGGEAPQVAFIGMTEYEESFDIPVAFPDVPPRHVLAEIISGAGMRQLHIAETEKYAHVTFFFNGGRDEPFPGEERRLIPSPRDVDTYDQKPEMSAHLVTAVFSETLAEQPVDFIILNFANPDMVAHTGSSRRR